MDKVRDHITLDDWVTAHSKRGPWELGTDDHVMAVGWKLVNFTQ